MSDVSMELKYSKVIRPRQRGIYVDDFGKLHKEPVSTESTVYREYRNTKRTIRGVTTPRKIQLIRWWFRYLKISLELEQQGYVFEERRKVQVKRKGEVGYKYKPVKEKVVVNRKKYEGWDLDQVLTETFDNWWKSHSHLFVETPDHIQEITSDDEIDDDPNYRYFRVDTRMTINETVGSLRKMLGSPKRSSKRTSLFTIEGEIRQEKLFNVYNTLVMSINGKSNKEILTSGLFRKSRGKEIKYIENVSSGGTQESNLKYQTRTKYEQDKSGRNMDRVQREYYSGPRRKGVSDTKFEKRGSKENLDRLRELLVPGRRLVLTVCDGYFSKHPKDKKYFGR
jgi:hypothetical protein